MSSHLYLDSNAGAPLRLNAAEALFSCLGSGDRLVPNPSSIHRHGRRAKRWLAEARERIALSLGAKTDPEQLVLTSSGTEANQLAIQSVLEPLLARGQKPHWITTAVEHDSIIQMKDWLIRRGGTVSVLPVDSQGNLEISLLKDLIQPETALMSILWVNNETGVISDIEAVSEFSRSAQSPGRPLLHIDAAQAWGKLPIDLAKLRAHFLTLSGHKIGGLAGTGVLWVAKGNPIDPVVLGKQEKGRRGGTENTAGWITVGAAAEDLDPVGWEKRVTPLRDRLEKEISERIPGTHVNGAEAPRVANTLNLSFNGIEGDGLVMALDLAGYSVSSGSACSSGALEPSHVLLAMGRTRQQAMAAIRISLSDEMPWENLEGFIQALERSVSRVRNAAKCQ